MASLIDISLVHNATEHNPERALELLQLYVHALDVDIELLISLLEQPPGPAIRKHEISHRMYGGAKMIGARSLANICQLVREADDDDIDNWIKVLIAEANGIHHAVSESIIQLKQH